LASELTKKFVYSAKQREGDEIPFNSNNEGGGYFVFLSSTSCNINLPSYREMGAFVSNERLCKVVHFLEHDDTKQFEKKKNEISSFKETILISLSDTLKK